MKRLIISLICIFAVLSAIAQFRFPEEEEQAPSFSDRFFWGGGLGLQFGDPSIVDVAPRIGYWITERWASGVGGSYLYSSSQQYDYKIHIYGGSLFSQYTILKDLSSILPVNEGFGGIVLYAEAEALNVDPLISVTNQDNERYWQYYPLAGGGIKFPLGAHSFGMLLILYNFNDSADSLYSNPVMRLNLLF